MVIMVSACLLGENCKYNGGNNRHDDLIELLNGHTVIPICPEVMGGLSTPRTPSEIVGDRIMNKDGGDVTSEYEKGAKVTLDLANQYQPDYIILQARSPSCGVLQRYDGTFSGTLIEQSGITAQILMEHGYRVIDSSQIGEWKNEISRSIS